MCDHVYTGTYCGAKVVHVFDMSGHAQTCFVRALHDLRHQARIQSLDTVACGIVKALLVLIRVEQVDLR